MEYEAVIGLEVHAQLKTKSKIFCACSTEFGAGPNQHVCPVCLGMPGVLPVLNKKALEYGIKCGIALNCEISENSKFDRKNYFYADLPKAYQVSQYDQPVCKNGHLMVGDRKVRIHRAHLEEDAGKLVHQGAAGLHGSDYSLADFNRTGVPLLEIVSEPDMRTPEEARDYLTELRTILRYLDVCDGNLEEGSFRCDANVSVRPKGEEKLGTKAEIKNMNSFKAVQRAIQSEIDRQIALVSKGEKVVQETRLWNEGTQSTFPMRSKEDAHDYRYFPEPDLVPMLISRELVDSIKVTIPELPEARRQRYVSEYALSAADAGQLVENKEIADFLDAAIKEGAIAKQTANLLLGPCMGFLNEAKKALSETRLSPRNLKDIVDSVSSGVLNSSTGKQVLLDVLAMPAAAADVSISEYVASKGLAQVSDEGVLKEMISKVLSDNPGQVAEFKGGKVKVRQFFVGAIMKASKGKANTELVNSLLDEALSS